MWICIVSNSTQICEYLCNCDGNVIMFAPLVLFVVLFSMNTERRLVVFTFSFTVSLSCNTICSSAIRGNRTFTCNSRLNALYEVSIKEIVGYSVAENHYNIAISKFVSLI